MNGTSAPNRRETSAISGSSVDTTVLVTIFDANAWAMEWPTNGLPLISTRFFLGIPLDPPRAGIIANVFNSIPGLCFSPDIKYPPVLPKSSKEIEGGGYPRRGRIPP